MPLVDGRPLSRRITLDEVVALNDEIAALVRAGVPLDRSLGLMGESLPSRLGTLAGQLAVGLEAGESLPDVLERDTSIPRAYAAIVRIGIRAGRLESALESTSRSARRLLELRRRTWMAMLYPGVILVLAYVMFLITVWFLTPAMVDAYLRLNDYSFRQMQSIEAGVRWATHWLTWIPAAVLLIAVPALWFRTRSRGGGKLKRAHHAAVFSEMLSLLVEREVPLDEAIELAADATGDQRLSSDARQVADGVRQGNSAAITSTGVPRLTRWLIETHGSRRDFTKALRRSADIYRLRANRIADWYAVHLPLWFTVGIGGTAVAAYAVYSLGPWLHVIYRFAKGA